MPEIPQPVSVRLPLSGEWCAVNTPGHRVPSHGSDMLGQRYAYDFVQIDWNTQSGYKFYDKPTLPSVLFGVKLEEVYCWSQPIFAPFDGEVIEARDGLKERNPVHVVRDLAVVLKNALFFRAHCNADLHPVLGNHLILKRADGVHALIAHARCGSIAVAAGDRVVEGQPLAAVGHSGNSTAPHLHFQLMDRPELLEAQGLPCCFRSYRSFKDGVWTPVIDGIPGRRERIDA